MSSLRKIEKDQDMSEQQHPFIEHESASQDTAKLPIIKPPNKGSRSHSRTSALHTHQEEQVPALQPASARFDIANEIYDPEIDESFAPTLKMPAFKKDRSPLTEGQAPLVLSPLEQEHPVAVTAYFSIPATQQVHRAATIADNYDFSEVDVEIIDMISYGLFEPGNKPSKEEQEILTEGVASSVAPVYEAIPLTSTASSSLVEDSSPLIETEVPAPIEEEITDLDSKTQIPVDEETSTQETVTHDEEEIVTSSINESSAEAGFTADPISNTTDVEAAIDAEPTEADNGLQTHDEDQSFSVEHEVL